MRHINPCPSCFTHPNGMWLLLAATIVVSASIPVSTIPPGDHANITSTTVHESSSLNIDVSKEDGLNTTRSYAEDSTFFESNPNATDNFASNTIDDQLIDVTSSLQNIICAVCAGIDYNSTDIHNSTTNSSNYVLSSVTESSGGASYFNVGIIIAISVLVIVIIGLIGGLGFFAYRHFAWNRPQTLTDKFSNDESTGYIDDTAFRENSEEMYSLDNDSFLNSLEAMTIQNYWTDHVRHTKL